jgi:arsenate reductase (thioredoxin)
MFNVLFLCTGNSARSILAEGILNASPASQGRLRAFSAGSHPKGRVHPMALDVLARQGISIDGYRSKSWDEFAAAGAPHIDVVITVCDQAAAETCPVWPGHPTMAHWGMTDPAAVEGSEETKRRAFEEAARILRRRIELLTSLPFEQLTQADREQQVRAIGSGT